LPLRLASTTCLCGRLYGLPLQPASTTCLYAYGLPLRPASMACLHHIIVIIIIVIIVIVMVHFLFKRNIYFSLLYVIYVFSFFIS
jgi:hypothetical protein